MLRASGQRHHRHPRAEVLEPRALLANTISGLVFDDLAANGYRDGDDAPVAGQTVELSYYAVQNQPPDVRTAVTGPDGRYTFDVPDGSYQLRYVPAGGRFASGFYYDRVRSFSLPSPWPLPDGYLDFATALPATVSGAVYNDADRDGARDAGEAPLPGVTLFADYDRNGRPGGFFGTEPTAVTDADGNYHFDRAPGSDRLRVQMPPGMVRTAPSTGFYEFTFRSGATFTGRDFGLAPERAVAGLTLIDAATDRPIGPLTHGMTIDLAQVGRRLNLRADLPENLPAADVGSVRFNFDGNPNYRIENAAPFSIGSDGGSDYRSWTPRPGTHSLVVTPYGADNAAGERGAPLLLNFNVIDTGAPAGTPLRVNAGGGAYATGAGETYAADSGFRDAIARSRSFSVAGTDDDALYASYRFGRRMQFATPVANGTYTLRLHFAEPVFTKSGRRIFDVFAEGRRVLDDYDVFSDAGARTARVKQFPVTVFDRRLDLSFVSSRDAAIVSAIELVPAPQSPAAPSPLYIDAGGTTSLTDSIGRVFDPDRGFTGGTTSPDVYDVGPVDLYDPTIAPDDRLLSTYRAGANFSFRHPVANGHYTLLLGFADPAEGAAVGSRTFDVSAEGRTILDDYDIVKAAGGPRTVAYESADVTVADGQLDLSFRGVIGEGLVSSIVLLPGDVPAAARPYETRTLSELSRRVFSAVNVRWLLQGIQMYANEHKGKFPAELPLVLLEGDVFSHDAFASPRAATLLPRGEMNRLESVAWAIDRNDYLYTGAGLDYRAPADRIVLYENPRRVAGPLTVGFADGHVELLDRAVAAARIGFVPNTPASEAPTFPDPASPPPSRDPAVAASTTNLQNISTALFRFSNENRGLFPPDFARAMETRHLPATTFVNPRGPTPVPPTGLSEAELGEWVLRRNDYTYLFGNRRTTSAAYPLAVAYETPSEMKGGLNLLFGDGHVEFRETRWAVDTIQRTRAWVAVI